MMTYEELQSVVTRNKTLLDELEESLRLLADKEEIARLTEETLDPEFWNDPLRAQTVQKRIAYLNKKNKRFVDLTARNDDAEVLLHLSEEMEDPRYSQRSRKSCFPGIATMRICALRPY